jgi:hypothetical protein
VVNDEGGVVANAIDEVGVAPVLEALSNDIETAVWCDAALLGDLAATIEHRHP